MKSSGQILICLLCVLLASNIPARSAQAQFTQQGLKLVGTPTIGTDTLQGYSVSVSGDGDTAIVGAPSDDGGIGAAWVHVRQGGI